MSNEELVYDSLKTIEGLEYQRKRAYVNMGSTDSIDGKMPRALLQMAQEIVSNSVDEALSGFGNEIEITIHEDGSMTVLDHGRGLPRDYIESDGTVHEFESALRAFTVAGTSGKFDNAGYSVSGGLNGLGAKGTTALSEWLEVEAQTNKGQHYRFRVSYDKWIQDNEPDFKENLEFDESEGTFTKVTFMPDERALASTDWERKALCDRYEMEAFLIPGVTIRLTDERDKDDETGKFWTKEWFSKDGLIDYINVLSEGSKPLKGMKQPISFDDTVETDEGYKVNIHGALRWIDNLGSMTQSFVNGIPTVEGGPHMSGSLRGINDAIRGYVDEKGMAKRFGQLSPSDIQEGLIITIEIKVPEPLMQFEGQTKEKYGSAAALPITKQIVNDALSSWLYDHPDEAENLIQKMAETKDLREKAAQARKDAKEAKKKKKESEGKLVVSSKLVKAIEKDPKKRELIITEGDSASGSIIQARSRNQAVFPLRGKLLNVLELPFSRILQNKEISTIASVLGAGIGPAFDVNDLEYDKLVVVCDADDDGAHISCLVMTMIYKCFPGMIQNGHAYLAKAPLFRISRYEKGNPINKYAFSVEEKDAILKDWSKYKDVYVTRFKGLGENNPEDLKFAVISPETRRLIRITVDDVAHAEKYLRVNMGGDANLRRDWVMENMSFSIDDYENM